MSQSLGTLPIGTVLPFAGEINDNELKTQGWIYCDGREIARDDYPELFSVIGNIYGSGDRVKTFNIPDYRGYFLRGVSGNSERDPDAYARTPMKEGGNVGNHVGTIQPDNFANHAHALNENIGKWSRSFKGEDGSELTICTNFNNGQILVQSNGGHETRPKNAYVNYIIKAKG